MGLGKFNRFVLQLVNREQVTSGVSEADIPANHVFAPCKCLIESIHFSCDVVGAANTLILYVYAGATKSGTQLGTVTFTAGASNEEAEATYVAVQRDVMYAKGQEFCISENGSNTKVADGIGCQISFREWEA